MKGNLKENCQGAVNNRRRRSVAGLPKVFATLEKLQPAISHVECDGRYSRYFKMAP